MPAVTSRCWLLLHAGMALHSGCAHQAGYEGRAGINSSLLLQAAKYEQMRCNNKVRFILAVVAGKLVISNRKRADINSELETQGYDKMPSRVKKVCEGGRVSAV